MHQLIPRFILQQLADDNRQGEFTAAGLFLDLSGFTALTDTLMQHDQHGAEVLAMVIKAIFDELVQLVYAQGGFIATFAGDAFLALFPAGQQPLPSACARALAAAWHMQAHLAAHDTHDTPYGSFTVTAKIGLACGEASWGLLFSADESEVAYYFEGSAVNDSTAAEHQAGQRETVLTQRFHDLVAALLRAEPLDGGFVRLLEVTGQLPQPQAIDLPPSDLDLLARFFPREVIVQEQSGEFRYVVNMFISLPTVRSHAQLVILSRSVFELTRQYGGLFNRFDFGDKGANLCLFWGMPITRETDIKRALSFILALRSRTSIPIKAGITYRIAYAGFSGSPLREEYTAYGRGVNLAARFMIAAPRDEVWVDEEIARRASQQFDIEYDDERAFKGFAAQQKVYVLFERKEAVELGARQPLLGRRDELQQMHDFIQPLFAGQAAGTLVLWGEAGIGKSRLVAAFLQEVQEGGQEGVQSLYCQADEILHESLNPFRYWLRHYFGQSTEASEARNKHSFNRKLDNLIDDTAERALAQELDRTRSCLGALLELHWPDSLYAQLDPQGRFENTLIALTTLMQAESLREPTIIVIEDAHWLDEDSRLYLQSITRRVGSPDMAHYPLAIIITARAEQAGSLIEDLADYREIELDFLSAPELGDLAAAILDGPIAPGLQGLLLERSQGNPFFAEQIVRYLQDEDLLSRSAAGWDVSARQSRLLPTDVRTLLVARLDRLTYEVRDGVERAAVLGREFDLRLLSMMLSDNSALSSMLEAGQQAVIWSALSQLRYIFHHALLRDAAYRMQLHARRQELHRLAARALTTLFADDLSPYYGELAHHTERGGLTDDARRYLQLAGDDARSEYYNSRAINFYSRALALTPASDHQARHTLLAAREEVYEILGARQEQAADLAALSDVVDALDDPALRAEISLRRSDYARITGDYDDAINAAQHAIAQAQLSGDLAREAAGHRQWAGALSLGGNYDAASEALERATALAEAANVSSLRANSLKDLGVVAYFQGNYTAARGFFEQALALYRREGDRRGETLCLQNQALVAMDMADYESARADSEQALVISRELGDRRAESLCLNNLASVARRLYDFPGSRRYYERSAAIYREIGDRRGQALCLNNLGLLACDVGAYETARRDLQEALQLYRDIGDRKGEGVCLNNLGIMAHDLGEHTLARDYLRQGLAVCREIGFRTVEGTILNELGLVEVDLGQTEQAQASFEQAFALRSELGQDYYLVEDRAGMALTALAQQRPRQAIAAINDVLQAIERDPNLLGAERPLNVHLISIRVLQAAQDRRAEAVLDRAYRLLLARAAQIADEGTRQSFLGNVPAHRQIVLQYETSTGHSPD